MSSNEKPRVMVVDSERAAIDRSVLKWLSNEYPELPVAVVTTESQLRVNEPGMAISSITNAYINKSYILGGYQAEYQFTLRNELKYARDQYGTVYISVGSIRTLNDDGSLNPAIRNGVIFSQLPVGFRPNIDLIFPVIVEAAGLASLADVRIGVSGYMKLYIFGPNEGYAIIALPAVIFQAGN